jgi:hypothetical protein
MERLPAIAAPVARRTHRVIELLQLLGYTAGGRPREMLGGAPRYPGQRQHDPAAAEASSRHARQGDTSLRIPFGNKEAALQLGARYPAGDWYAAPGVDLDSFRQRGWL